MKRVRKASPISLDIVIQSNAHTKKVDECDQRRKQFEKRQDEILHELHAADTKLRKEKHKLIKEGEVIEKLLAKRINYIRHLYVKEFGGKIGNCYWFEITPTSRIVKLILDFGFIDNDKRIKAASLMFKGGKETGKYRAILPIPIKWLYEDFEEEFYSKAKMIKTFQ